MLKRVQNILFILVMIALFVPLINQTTGVPKVKKLNGVFWGPKKDSLNLENWFSGKFQDSYVPYYEYEIGCRPFFIRTKNQLRYSLFNKSARTTIIGKEGQLFDLNYYKALIGTKLEPRDSLRKRFTRLAQVFDSIKAMGKTPLVVIAPNKVEILKDYMPDEYDMNPVDSNAYQIGLAYMKRMGVQFVDFHDYFLDNFDTLPYPVLSNTGIHWTGYGLQLAVDSFFKVMEIESGMELVDAGIKSWELSTEHEDFEADLANFMNIFTKIKTQELARAEYYPRDSSATKAKVLVIGDSFFWNFYPFKEVFHRMFDDSSKFWYYSNSEIDWYFKSQSTVGLSARKAVMDADYVIFLTSAFNMNTFPFGFETKFLGETDSIH